MLANPARHRKNESGSLETISLFMTPSSYVRERQKLWALRNRKAFDDAGYVVQPDDNMFESLSAETIAEFENADGQELTPKGKNAAKMNALHSSSALAVNVFQYWRNRDKTPLAKALKIPSVSIREIRFEELAPISENVNRKKFPRDPNIDVVIEYQRGKPGLVGIESKFSEAYGKHEGLKAAYLAPELWDGLPNCLALAKEASVPKVGGLNTPQLLKHILGMKQSSGVSNFWLVYLWYASSGPELGDHYSQLDEFKRRLGEDGIRFHFLTYQELICRLGKSLRKEHCEYIDYIVGRYI